MDEDDYFKQQKRKVKIADKIISEKQKEEEKEEEIRLKEEQKQKELNDKSDKKNKKKVIEEEGLNEAQKESQMDAESQDQRISKVPGGKKKKKKVIKEVTNPAQLVDNAIGKPYFLVPDTTPQDISKSDAEETENKVRRWDIFVCEIKLENLQKEDLSVFLNFRIGQIGKNKEKFEDVSSEEVFFKSEIVKDVKRSEIKSVKVTFRYEMHLSYQMLKERYFVIEVWEYRRFVLNLFLGKIQVSLLNIVSGNMARQDNIKKATGEKRQFARIYYKMMFQEVWDYKLTFEAWKGQNIMGELGATIKANIELALQTDEEPTVVSDVMPKVTNPNFKDLKGFMHYRGTLESLTEQMILITIYKDKYFAFAKKLVSLRGIQDTNYLKTQFRLNLKKPPTFKNKNTQQLKKSIKLNLMNEDGDEDEEDEEDMLSDKSIYCVLEGRINLNRTPRYMQVGELNRYVAEQYYLVIIINRLEKVLAPDDRGVINTFLTVSWRDQQKVTQTMKDNSNPTFNEELYFRIPLLKPVLTLEDIINQKTAESLMKDSIREELRNRPDINIYLWLDGADVLSDESLGYCRVFLSDIQKAAKQPKSIVTAQNQTRTFETRIQTFKKKFTSGLFNITPITIQFQACFVPDLPDDIDLSDFNTVPPDFYPLEISEQMELGIDWKKKNAAYKKWEKQIRYNFYGYGGIEKNAYALFYNSIFVKDQYDYVHLVCKYLEKFYVRYQSQEGTRQLFANPADISVNTLHELVHFVRNIPFISDSFSKKEVWISPDFLLKIRKGFAHDHAVLAACLFLGCEIEDTQAEQQKWKDYIPLEHRTFVCLGTLKLNSNPHAWVMTFSYTLDKVIFWDIQDNKRFELMGRVARKEIKKLRKFLFPEFTAKKQDKGLFAIRFDAKKKVSKKQIKREQKIKKEKALEVKLKADLALKLIKEKKEKEDQDGLRKKDREYAKFQADDLDFQEQQQIELNDIALTRTKIKNDRQMGVLDKSMKGQTQVSMDKTVERPVFQNPFGRQNNSSKKGVLEQREEAQEVKRKQNKEAKFTQEDNFYHSNGSQHPADQFELPYATLEIVFNQKNVFANLGNQNPQQILYHFHKKDDWLPFVNYEKEKKVEGAEDSDDDDDEEDEEEEEELIGDDMNTVAWMQKMGAFYGAQILSEPLRKDKLKKLMKDIYYEIQGGIVKTRAKEGLSTKWKHENDSLNNKMLELLEILEYRDTDRKMKIIRKDIIPDEANPTNKLGILKENEEECDDYQYILHEWSKEVKKLIPLNYKFEALPIKFTYTQSEKMRTIIVENMSSFFMVDHKKIIFNLIGRIFNYPNKVNCVRLILAYTYSQVQEAVELQSDKGSEDDEEDYNSSQGKQLKQHQQPLLQQIDEEDDQEKLLPQK